MKKAFLFFKLLFFSVFATTKMLENVEEDLAALNGENSEGKHTTTAANQNQKK